MSVLLATSGCKGSDARAASPVPHQEAPPAVEYDHAATDTARVLAGLEPEDATRFVRVTSNAAWRGHRAEFDGNWVRLDAERLAVMRGWRDRELQPQAGACDTLFYPFGGPDFLNAYVLYPGCNRYLLFGLEPVGSVPSLDRPTDAAVDVLLEQLRASLSDVFVRDYFITKTMMNELRTREIDGTLPLLLVFLARLDARIVDITMANPWESQAATAPVVAPAAASPGRPQPRRVPGVTIRFMANGSSRVQSLSYVRVQMEDPAFAKQTGMLEYLDRVAPFTTLLKSASYLLHDNHFSGVRSLILARSRSVLQDDTGVPFRYFDRTAWDLTLFGRYMPPVKDFNYGLQPDLDAAYKATAAAHELPFTFGYHWRQGTSNVMLAVRRAATR